MSAILVLLAVFGFATVAARRRAVATFAHLAGAPLLFGLGALVAPQGLGFLTAEMLHDLEPALDVAVAWLALLVGLRIKIARPTRITIRNVLAFCVGAPAAWFITSAGALLALFVVQSEGLALNRDTEQLAMLGCAVLLGGIVGNTGHAFAAEALFKAHHHARHQSILFLSRYDDVVGASALLIATYLWPLSGEAFQIYAVPWMPAVVVFGLAATLALAAGLIGGRPGDTTTGFVGLVGLLTFAAGLSVSTHLPAAALAFFLGVIMAPFGLATRLVARGIDRTERPVRLATLFLVGTHLGFSESVVWIGLSCAGARLVAKAVVASIYSRVDGAPVPFAALLASSGMALPFAVSFALARPEPLVQSGVLAIVAVAVAATDVVNVGFWMAERFNQRAAAEAAT